MYVHELFAFIFFNDTATTEIYTLSLHDALPISRINGLLGLIVGMPSDVFIGKIGSVEIVSRLLLRISSRLCRRWNRSEEHTSELQSRQYLVCRFLLEKKKYNTWFCISTRSQYTH